MPYTYRTTGQGTMANGTPTPTYTAYSNGAPVATVTRWVSHPGSNQWGATAPNGATGAGATRNAAVTAALATPAPTHPAGCTCGMCPFVPGAALGKVLARLATGAPGHPATLPNGSHTVPTTAGPVTVQLGGAAYARTALVMALGHVPLHNGPVGHRALATPAALATWVQVALLGAPAVSTCGAPCGGHCAACCMCGQCPACNGGYPL